MTDRAEQLAQYAVELAQANAELERALAEHQATEARLEQERYLLQALMDHLPNSIYFKDRQSRFLRISKACAIKFGLTDPAQAVGKTDYDFFTPEHARPAMDDERRLIDTGEPLVDKEEKETWPDGTTTWVATTKMPLRAEDGRIVGTFGISYDITARKQVEERTDQLRASEERFALAVRGSTDGIWDWNVLTDAVYFSPRFKELLDYQDHEFTNHFATFEVHLHAEDRARVLKGIQDHLDHKAPYDVEYRLHNREGRYRWFRARGQAIWDSSGRPTRMAGSITDITEQKRLRQRFELAVEASPAALLMIDRQGRIVLVNSQCEMLFGYSHGELTGQSVVLLVPERFRASYPQYLSSYFQQPGPRTLGAEQLLVGLRQDGQEFALELGLNPVETEEGLAVLCGVVDVTARLQAMEAMNCAKEAAEAASRAKSDFLANMSHEIRTPMNAIIGMTELVLDTPLRPTQREYLEMSRESAASLLGLINDILDFSKIEAGRLDLEQVAFDLRECVGDTMKSLALRAHRKNLELACHIATDVPEEIVSDPSRLRQIIVNLVGNAIKFTEQGEVLVQVTCEGSKAANRQLHMVVRDTGIGIPAKQQHAIFDAFVQADASTTRRYGGTGLGLSISQRLVQLMGGRIWVESEPGEGSAFHFTLALKLPSGEKTRPVGLSASDLRGTRVLVVDDNATNRLILEEMLRNWGLVPTVVSSAEEALAALRSAHQSGQGYALVLTDSQMPDIDGFMLSEQIRADNQCSSAIIMMLTSGDRPGDVARCDELGLAAYLIKPVKQSELFDAIALALGLRPATDTTEHVGQRVCHGSRSLRILLAEDSIVNQKLAVAVLTKWRHRVTVANNGVETLAHLQASEFDLVLMDVQMPELDGLEATTEIRSREKQTGRHIPIIAMTAHAMKGDRERCLASGMDSYVCKPIDQEQLFEAIERLVGVGSPTSHSAPNAAIGVDHLSPSNGHPDLEVMDLAAAGKRIPGGPAGLAEMAELLIQECPKMLAEVRAAIATGDAAGLQRSAHTLKGSAAIFAAQRVVSAALALEVLGREHKLYDAPAALLELEREVACLCEALAPLVGAHSG